MDAKPPAKSEPWRPATNEVAMQTTLKKCISDLTHRTSSSSFSHEDRERNYLGTLVRFKSVPKKSR